MEESLCRDNLHVIYVLVKVHFWYKFPLSEQFLGKIWVGSESSLMDSTLTLSKGDRITSCIRVFHSLKVINTHAKLSQYSVAKILQLTWSSKAKTHASANHSKFVLSAHKCCLKPLIILNKHVKNVGKPAYQSFPPSVPPFFVQLLVPTEL